MGKLIVNVTPELAMELGGRMSGRFRTLVSRS